ncbi:MAG: hypothetical protein JXR03_06010 [Cyclobacteriaceae bacterium]
MKRTEMIQKYVFSLLVLCFCLIASAQSTRMEKKYDKSFPANEGGRLDINNKYGEVIIRVWDRDSVRVMVNIEAAGKTSATVQKNMERIDITFRAVGDLITASTVVRKGSGFFKELMSEVDDYSKSIFGSNGLKVNYEVWIPEDFNLNVENKFGNIYMADLSGKVSLYLAHGDLKANRLDGEVSIRQSFGKNNIDFIKDGTLTYRGVESRIGEAKVLKVESSSSELEIDDVTYVQLNSRNDKIYITEADEIVGDGTFSDLTADVVHNNVSLNFNYGDIYFRRIQQDFKSISLVSKSADINLILDQASYVLTNITADERKMIVPNSMLLLKKEMDEQSQQITLSGFVGNTQSSYGELNIRSEGGEVIIAIKELPLFSDKD